MNLEIRLAERLRELVLGHAVLERVGDTFGDLKRRQVGAVDVLGETHGGDAFVASVDDEGGDGREARVGAVLARELFDGVVPTMATDDLVGIARDANGDRLQESVLLDGLLELEERAALELHPRVRTRGRDLRQLEVDQCVNMLHLQGLRAVHLASMGRRGPPSSMRMTLGADVIRGRE